MCFDFFSLRDLWWNYNENSLKVIIIFLHVLDMYSFQSEISGIRDMQNVYRAGPSCSTPYKYLTQFSHSTYMGPYEKK